MGGGGGCRGRRAHPAAPSPRRERPPRPAGLGEPGLRVKCGCGGRGAVREALPAGCLSWSSGLGEGIGIWGRPRTQGTPSQMGEAGGARCVGSGRFRQLRWPCSPSRDPTLAPWRGEACRAASQPSLLFSRLRSSSSFLPQPRFQAMMCFTTYHF